MKSSFSALTPRRIELFCERRLAPVLPADITLALQGYLVGLLARKEFPPYRRAQIDFEAIAEAISYEAAPLRSQRAQLQPILDAVARSVAEAELRLRANNSGKARKSAPPREAKRPVGRPRKGHIHRKRRGEYGLFSGHAVIGGSRFLFRVGAVFNTLS
jgi:hypothetical protein